MLLNLIYKLNFIIGMYVSEKTISVRVWYYPWFQAPTGHLESILLGYVGITVIN